MGRLCSYVTTKLAAVASYLIPKLYYDVSIVTTICPFLYLPLNLTLWLYIVLNNIVAINKHILSVSTFSRKHTVQPFVSIVTRFQNYTLRTDLFIHYFVVTDHFGCVYRSRVSSKPTKTLKPTTAKQLPG